jgi:hypothetical protein
MIKHNQKFWKINTESYFSGDDMGDFISYQWIVPLYIYSISKIHNGSEEFDLSPVDYSDPKNIYKSYNWRISHKHEDINSTIFTSKEDAVKSFNEKYKEVEINRFRKLHRNRLIIANRIEDWRDEQLELLL